jgi:hypothetical protein
VSNCASGCGIEADRCPRLEIGEELRPPKREPDLAVGDSPFRLRCVFQCDVAVSHYLCGARTEDAGSYSLAWNCVRTGLDPPHLALGRRLLATDRRAGRQLPGCVDDCDVRIRRVAGRFRAGERLPVRTVAVAGTCVCGRPAWRPDRRDDGGASACGGGRCPFAVFRSRQAGAIYDVVADRCQRRTGPRSNKQTRPAGGGWN